MPKRMLYGEAAASMTKDTSASYDFFSQPATDVQSPYQKETNNFFGDYGSSPYKKEKKSPMKRTAPPPAPLCFETIGLATSSTTPSEANLTTTSTSATPVQAPLKIVEASPSQSIGFELTPSPSPEPSMPTLISAHEEHTLPSTSSMLFNQPSPVATAAPKDLLMPILEENEDSTDDEDDETRASPESDEAFESGLKDRENRMQLLFKEHEERSARIKQAMASDDAAKSIAESCRYSIYAGSRTELHPDVQEKLIHHDRLEREKSKFIADLNTLKKEVEMLKANNLNLTNQNKRLVDEKDASDKEHMEEKDDLRKQLEQSRTELAQERIAHGETKAQLDCIDQSEVQMQNAQLLQANADLEIEKMAIERRLEDAMQSIAGLSQLPPVKSRKDCKTREEYAQLLKEQRQRKQLVAPKSHSNDTLTIMSQRNQFKAKAEEFEKLYIAKKEEVDEVKRRAVDFEARYTEEKKVVAKLQLEQRDLEYKITTKSETIRKLEADSDDYWCKLQESNYQLQFMEEQVAQQNMAQDRLALFGFNNAAAAKPLPDDDDESL